MIGNVVSDHLHYNSFFVCILSGAVGDCLRLLPEHQMYDLTNSHS